MKEIVADCALAIEKVLSKVDKEFSALICCIQEEENTTRLSNSEVHQNTSFKDISCILKLKKGKKEGVSFINQIDDSSIDFLYNSALNTLDVLPEKSYDVPLNLPSSYKEINAFYTSYYSFNPEKKIILLKEIVDRLNKNSLKAHGAFSTKKIQTYIGNTNGLRSYFEESLSKIHIIAEDKFQNTGFYKVVERDPEKIDPLKIAEEVILKTKYNGEKISLPSGNYTVLLEPEAIAHLILFLSFILFNGKSYIRGRSFFNKGDKITGENITIYDDWDFEGAKGMPFDYEGTPRQKLTLIENGVFKNFTTDNETGIQMGIPSSGHSQTPDNTYGPYPKNIVFSPGDKTKEELIKETETGILITRFWYVNIVNPVRTILTATTRDGTILIENGKLKKTIRDMRFTGSVLEILSNTIGMSEDLTTTHIYGSFITVPILKIKDFPLWEI